MQYSRVWPKQAKLAMIAICIFCCFSSALVGLSAGGLFPAVAQQGSQRIPLAITESAHAPRTATAHLLLEQAGKWTVTVSHASGSEITDVSSNVLTSHEVVVEEAADSAGCSRLTGFWPPQGAIAGVPATFVIQVSIQQPFFFFIVFFLLPLPLPLFRLSCMLQDYCRSALLLF